MTASSVPTATVSSSLTLIDVSPPAVGAGISVSTLSVDTSSSGSSAATVSPSCLSQRVTVPSVTLSPSAGRVTETDICLGTPNSSAEGVQRLAGQREMRFADRLSLGRVHVDELGDVGWDRFPVVDELRLGDQLADPAAPHMDADDRALLLLDHFHRTRRMQDLALRVAGQVERVR